MTEEFHRYAVLVAISALLVIVIGAYITSQASGRQPASRGILDATVHRSVAMVVSILTLGLAVWQSLGVEAPFLGWTAMGFIVLDAWAGWLGGALLHASLAPLAFAILVAIALVTSSGWNQTPELVGHPISPFLWRLAIATPPLILLQIMLGAAYRHKLTTVMPHLEGAMIVALVALVLSGQVLQHCAGHRALRSSAIWLMSTVLAQVLLGVTALIAPSLKIANPISVIVATASHVVVGSLTLAASLVLAMRVQRSMRRAPSEKQRANSL